MAGREVETLDDLRELITSKAREIGEDFTTPKDDWRPIAFVQATEGLGVIPLPNEMFKSGFTKDVLGEVLRVLVAEVGAYRYAVLLNTHVAVAPSPEQVEAIQGGLRVEQIEGAREMLLLLVGDAEEEQVWIAPIECRPETLIRSIGEWDRVDREGSSFSGRFTGLNTYLQEVR